MERKKLLKSQKELIGFRRDAVNVAINMFNLTLANIAIELEIPGNELNLWRVSSNDEYFEKTVEDIKPQFKIPKGK